MKAKTSLKEEIKTQIKGIILLAAAVFCFAGVQYADQTGRLGIFVYNTMHTLAGETAILVPFLIGVLALRTMLPAQILSIKSRLTGILILMILTPVFVHLRLIAEQMEAFADLDFMSAVITSIELGLQHQGGGVVGGLLAVLLFHLLNIGSYIVIGALALVALMLITNVSLTQVFAFLKKAGQLLLKLLSKIAAFLSDTYRVLMDASPEEKARAEKKSNNRLSGAEYSLPVEVEPATGLTIENGQAGSIDGEDDRVERHTAVYQKERRLALVEPVENGGVDSGRKKATAAARGQYIRPSLELLSRPSRSGQQQVKGIKDRARLLEATLQSFGVKARVIHVQSGPTVTRFEVQPEAGVKVSKILSLSDDLALNMAAPLVRIEAPIPGKAALGIEVPNKIIALVYLREVLEDIEFLESFSALTVGLGKDITGVPVVTDLTRMPHLLIAGSTGSGKSVCLNTIIISILYKARPDQVRFLMIDPKVVELSSYNGIPHLLTPVVTDPKKASLALRNMVREMSRRYELFAKHGVRDITSYNEKMNGRPEPEPLPYIVVVIDELADLMLVSPGEVEDAIARLAQMSRAAGIHLVIATQRPSVDVLTGIIKANITSRIAFTVSSQVDSRTILDMAGAEKLLGRGDMLFYPVGSVKPLRVQCAYVSEREVKRVTDFIREQGEAEYDEELENLDNTAMDQFEMDELFPDAVELVVRTGQASISLLQRRFRIGYTRAARLIDDLERKGVVGEHEGSKPREVIITPEQAARLFEDLKNKPGF
jgi:S-DNA-T family DNA segregation ATPase FtsK/SpoIIIE